MTSRRTRRRAACLAAALATLFAMPALSQEKPLGQSGNVWNLGTVEAGKRYRTSVSATNVNCRGAHDFQIEFEHVASRFLSIDGENIARGVKKGETKTLPAWLDTHDTEPGEYKTGFLVSRCLDCSPSCRLNYSRIDIEVTIVAPQPPPGGGSGTSTAGEAGTPSEGTDEEQRRPKRCGPEVGDEFTRILDRVAARLRGLPKGDRTPDNAKAFLARNPPILMPQDPAAGSPCGSGVCAKSVTLFGECVPYLAPQWLLRGFVERLLGVTEGKENENHRDGFGLRPEVEQEELAGFAIGSGWAQGLFAGGSYAPPTGPLSLSTGELGPDLFDSLSGHMKGGGIGPVLQGKYFQCLPCGTAAGFAYDWSKETWALSGGGRSTPPPD